MENLVQHVLIFKQEKKLRLMKKETWETNRKVTRDTFNYVYLILCDKYGEKKKSIGESGRLLKNQLSDHRGYITIKILNVSIRDNFNLPGHRLANVKITILDQVKKNDTMYRKEIEKYFIYKFNIYH